MAKYNYSLTRKNARGQEETLQVVNCDSFDEAIRAVEKGVRDRELAEAPTTAPVPSSSATVNPPSTSTTPTAVPDMIVPLDGDGNPIPKKDENN